MKRILPLLISMLLLAGCDGRFFQPFSYKLPTPFRAPTQTPYIITATPLLATSTPAVVTPVPATTDTPILPPTDTALPEATTFVPAPSVAVEVLGCNTSIDITHGLGEVTNAFVTLTNTGNTDLTHLKATLFALDEGRQHPDKTVEIALLPVALKVTVKLTVDSTYKADTPIQVEVSADGELFQRVGEASCKDIGVFAPDPASLNTPVPVNP